MATNLSAEQIRALGDDDLSDLAWRIYCEQQERLNRRRMQMRPLGIALNIMIAALLYAYFGATRALGRLFEGLGKNPDI
jgi:hypothetical protein